MYLGEDAIHGSRRVLLEQAGQSCLHQCKIYHILCVGGGIFLGHLTDQDTSLIRTTAHQWPVAVWDIQRPWHTELGPDFSCRCLAGPWWLYVVSERGSEGAREGGRERESSRNTLGWCMCTAHKNHYIWEYTMRLKRCVKFVANILTQYITGVSYVPCHFPPLLGPGEYP